jgi:hypothetical protein
MEAASLPKFFFKAFRAIDDFEASMKFQEGHTRVLTDVGISSLTSSEPTWISDPDVYVLNVYDEEQDVVAGLRVHRYNGKVRVPMIDALEDQCPEIEGIFKATLPKGTAEICGLWGSRKVFGKGLSPYLCICSVVMVEKMGLSNFYCFAAPYTEKMIKSMGCVLVDYIGVDGRFPYPTEKFMSAVLYNPDVHQLLHAEAFNKARMLSLMENPIQTFEESAPKGQVVISYDLSIQ